MAATERSPMSLTTRVMLFVALATGLCLLMVGGLVQTSIARHFAEQDAEELQVVADSVFGILQHNDHHEPALLAQALSLAVSGHHGVYFQVADRYGNTIYATPGADLSAVGRTFTPVATISLDGLQTWQDGDNSYRGVLLEFQSETQEFFVTTAADMEFHLHFLASFHRALWSILACAAALTLLAVWVGVHQGHAPLRKLSNNIRSIQSDHLHVRLDPVTVPVELRDLVLSFNQMIGRLEEGFARLSNFSADIAHELRTPLTNLITQTQVGLSKARQQEEYKELLYSNLEEQERLAKMVSDMLWLAQTDHGLLKPEFGAVNLAREVCDLTEYFADWAGENQIQMAVEGDELLAQGDRSMLRRALSNLLSNAISHTPAGGKVSIRLSSTAIDRVQISVQNSGKGIPAEHQSRVFDRFYRIDPSRQRQREGVGLGLAIVKSIIEIHGGQVDARSNDGLTTFTITLPGFMAAAAPSSQRRH